MLLRYLLGLDRTALYLDRDRSLDPADFEDYSRLIERRLNHEPIAYITGHREFFLLDLQVTPAVLIPRPETETLVEKAIETAKQFQTLSLTIADLGTGCGAIAVTLAVNLPRAKVYATDVSEDALEVARANCERHEVSDRVTLLRGNLLEPVPEPVNMIVANLPYVAQADLERLPRDIYEYEPRRALDGGVDGLAGIEKMLAGAGRRLLPGGSILFEIGCDQGDAARELARTYFPASTITLTTDLSDLDRVVSIHTPAARDSGVERAAA